MKSSTAPTTSTGRAVREVLRDRGWWAWMVLASVWVGYFTWSDWVNESRADGVVFGTWALVFLGTLTHRQVRLARGFDGPHGAMPLVAGAASLVILVVADAIDPVMSMLGMLVYCGGLTVILGVFTYAELRADAEPRQGRPRSATGGPR